MRLRAFFSLTFSPKPCNAIQNAESGEKSGNKKCAPRNRRARILICKNPIRKTAADYDRATATANAESAEIEKYKNAAQYLRARSIFSNP